MLLLCFDDQCLLSVFLICVFFVSGLSYSVIMEVVPVCFRANVNLCSDMPIVFSYV